MIGDYPVFIDTDDNFTNNETTFWGMDGLWELLTSKNVNMEIMNKADLKTFKNIDNDQSSFEQISAGR